ncbi:MAG: ABC transporter ATP-binding protein [Promethearchaeota archaeon]
MENKADNDMSLDNIPRRVILEVSGVNKYFLNKENKKIEILKDISFKLFENEFISIVGPSGCGKTTLLRIIAGFDDNYQGSIRIYNYDNNDRDPSTQSQSLTRDHTAKNKKSKNHLEHENNSNLLGKIGYVPQEDSLFPWKTVEGNIRFGLKAKNIPEPQQKKIVKELLDLVGLPGIEKYFPKELSGGMKQKVAICRALAVNPQSHIILMDEPFSALDSQSRNLIQDDLINIFKKQKLNIIFVTHNLDEAIYLSDRVIILSNKPAKIKEIVQIDLPHPRDRTSTQFQKYRKHMFQLLKEEIIKDYKNY